MTNGEARDGREKSSIVPALSLLLTAVVAGAGFFLFLSGPQVRVSEPKDVLIYRTGAEPNALLSFAFPLDMSNWSQGHNDRIKTAVLQAERLPFQVRTSGARRLEFVNRPERICEREMNECVHWPKLAVVDLAGDNMLVKAGEPTPRTLAFEVLCPPNRATCNVATYSDALRSIGQGPITFSISLHFERDGSRTIHCTVERIYVDYIQRVGWQSAECSNARVEGNNLF